MVAIDIPVAAMTEEQRQELAVPEFDPSYRLPTESFGLDWIETWGDTVIATTRNLH